jgi:hypothetical protein
MDGFTNTLEPMSNKEGDKINEWIYKHSHSHVQERRKGDKWKDSEAL